MQASRLFFGAIVFLIAVVAWFARPPVPPAAGLPLPLAEQVPQAPVPVAQEQVTPPVLQLDGMAAPEDPAPIAPSASTVAPVAQAGRTPVPPPGLRVAALPVQARAQAQPQAEVLRPVHRPRHPKTSQARHVRTAAARARLVARAQQQQRRGVIVSVVSNKALWLP